MDAINKVAMYKKIGSMPTNILLFALQLINAWFDTTIFTHSLFIFMITIPMHLV